MPQHTQAVHDAATTTGERRPAPEVAREVLDGSGLLEPDDVAALAYLPIQYPALRGTALDADRSRGVARDARPRDAAEAAAGDLLAQLREQHADWTAAEVDYAATVLHLHEVAMAIGERAVHVDMPLRRSETRDLETSIAAERAGGEHVAAEGRRRLNASLRRRGARHRYTPRAAYTRRVRRGRDRCPNRTGRSRPRARGAGRPACPRTRAQAGSVARGGDSGDGSGSGEPPPPPPGQPAGRLPARLGAVA